MRQEGIKTGPADESTEVGLRGGSGRQGASGLRGRLGLTVGELPWLMLAAPYYLNREMFYPADIDWPHDLWVLQSAYWGFVLACAITAGLFFARRRADSMAMHVADVISGFLMAIGVLLVHALALGPSPHAVFAGMCLCGAGAAWQFARWGQCVAGLGLRRAIAYICCSFALAGALKCAIFALPFARVAVDLALSALAVVALRLCLGAVGGGPATGRASEQADGQPGVRFGEPLLLSDIWLIPVAIALLGGSIGVLYAGRYITFGTSDGFQVLLGGVLEVAAAVVVFAWVCVRRRPLSIVGVLASITAVMATSATLLATLGEGATGLAFFLTSVDNVLLTLFLWILLAALVGRVDWDPRRLFASGWLVLSASAFLGALVAKATLLRLTPVTCAVLMYVACMALIAVIAGRNVSTSGVFDALAAEVPQDTGGLSQRCGELAQAYHLTAREAEVLELLASGRSRPYIAESLCISENTVRVYTSKIYGKLGIHDRSSLFRLAYGTRGAGERDT